MCYAALLENQITVFMQAIKGKEEVKAHNHLLRVGKQRYIGTRYVWASHKNTCQSWEYVQEQSHHIHSDPEKQSDGDEVQNDSEDDRESGVDEGKINQRANVAIFHFIFLGATLCFDSI